MLYLSIILITNLVVILINIILSATEAVGFSLLRAVLVPPFLTLLVIGIDGVFAFIIRRLPEKWFSCESKLSNVSHAESDLYRRLGVRKWRDKIPELGCFTNFHKDHIYEPTNNEYLKRFILEANYGAVIHFVCVPVGFLIFLTVSPAEILLSGVPVVTVNAVLNLLPAFVLRYNVPKLISLMKINDRRSARAEITAKQ
jgi:glycosyl-4,4'-diaponeurosporenoate acyltransferase